ncbi:hypothetical protein [Aquimarina brevivitae]|nr:hypothetical protein [Aquimarina brevivitae]
MDLDKSINIPITILTLIIGLNSIYTDREFFEDFFCELEVVQVMIITIGITILISAFFLIKSYNNLFKGFAYRNLALTKDIREFETKQIPDYNSQVSEEDKLTFETELIERLITVTDNHTTFNDQRSLDLYRAKTFLIVSLILTGIQLVIVTFK